MRIGQRRRRSLRESSGRNQHLCERVEPRLLLACDMVFVDGTLQISGDGASNTVLIAEGRFGVSVICDGQTATFDGVRAVRIATGDGDDSVTFVGQSDIGIEELVIQTEGGDDQVDIVFATGDGEAEPLRALRMRVDAGVGADRVQISYDNQRDAQELDVVMSVNPGGVGPATQALPDPGDEVLVGFSHGSLSNRLYVGNLSWHSTDASDTRLPGRQASVTLVADTSAENLKPLYAFTVIGTDGRDEVSSDSLLLPVFQGVSTASYHVDLGEGENKAAIRFGDGQQGSTPPAGERNINATYRGGAGDDTVEISGAMSDRLAVSVDIDTGDGDDSLTSRVESYGSRRTPVATYSLEQAWPSKYSGVTRTGGGNDLVQIDVSGFETVENDITTGEGDDEVAIGLLLPAVQKVREAATRTNVLLGGGNDRVQIDVDGIDPRGATGADALDLAIGLAAVEGGRSSAAINVVAGDGDDDVRVRYDGDYVLTRVEHAATGVEASVDLGPGDNALEILSEGADESNVRVFAGDGNNAITIKPGTAAKSGQAWPSKWYVPTTGSASVHVGDGNNRVQVEVSGYDRADNTITAGDGSNEVLVGLLLPAVQKVRDAAANVDTQLGDGNNRVSIEVDGYDRAGADLTAGDGDNEILIGLLLPAVQKVRAAAARVEVDLGGGENNLVARMTGGARSLIGKPKEIVVVGSKIREGAVSAHLVTGSVETRSTGLLNTRVSGLTVGGSLSIDVGDALAADSIRAEGQFADVNVLPGATLSYAAAGGSSADVLAVGFDNPTIGTGATVAVSLLGGGGNDVLAARVRGAGGGGALDVNADGGDGDDRVSAMIELPPDPFRAALERVSVLVLGGAGNDTLYLSVLPDDLQRGYVVAKLDGGEGFDACFATRDVEVLNCEDHLDVSGGDGQ